MTVIPAGKKAMILLFIMLPLFTMTQSSANAAPQDRSADYKSLKEIQTKELRALGDEKSAFDKNDKAISVLTKIMADVVGDPGFVSKPASFRLQPETLLVEVGFECVDGMRYSFAQKKEISAFVTTETLVAPYLKDSQAPDLPILFERLGSLMMCNNASLIPIATITGLERKGLDTLHAVISRSAQDYGPPHAAHGVVVLAKQGTRLYFLAHHIEKPTTQPECEAIWKKKYQENAPTTEVEAHDATMACYAKFYQTPAQQKVARDLANRMLSLLK